MTVRDVLFNIFVDLKETFLQSVLERDVRILGSFDVGWYSIGLFFHDVRDVIFAIPLLNLSSKINFHVAADLSSILAVAIADTEEMSRRKTLDVRCQNVLVLINLVWIVRVIAHSGCEGKLSHAILAFSELLFGNFVGLVSHRRYASARILRLGQFLASDDGVLVLAFCGLLLFGGRHLKLLLGTRWRRMSQSGSRRETCGSTSLDGLRLILDESRLDLRVLGLLIFRILFLVSLKTLRLLRIARIDDFASILAGLTAELPGQLRILLLIECIVFDYLLILSPVASRDYLSVFCYLSVAVIHILTVFGIEIQGLLLDVLHLVFGEIVTLVDSIVGSFAVLLTLISILLILLNLDLVVGCTTQVSLVSRESTLSLRRWHLAAVLSWDRR